MAKSTQAELIKNSASRKMFTHLASAFLLSVSTSALIFLNPSLASASPLECEALFDNTSLSQSASDTSSARSNPATNPATTSETTVQTRDGRLDTPTLQVKQRSLLNALWNEIRPKKFSASEFEAAKAQYREKLAHSEPIQPRSNEERLALFELLSEKNSLGFDQLSQQLQSMKPADQTKFANLFSKRRFDKGFRVEEAHKLFTTMYLLTHVEPRAWREVLTKPLSTTFESIIRQRAEMEFGKYEFVTALDHLGLIRKVDSRAKIQTWMAKNSGILELARTVGLNALSYSAFGLFNRVPNVQALLAKPAFKRSSLDLLRTMNWAGARETLLKEGQRFAYIDLSLSIGKKVTSTILMGVAIAYFAPMMLQATLPPGFTDQDEGFFALANDSVQYWYGVAYTYVTGEAPSYDPSSRSGSGANQQFQQDLDNALNALNNN